ncbi:lipase [Amycolatopsis antarctica]|uniref:Lipase n=1 Tax=Amycolatopsis antarctica TaxID=1854586 RepID=A0A263D5G0_9PSEU|nr:SGNH/GDSL hydrolase family protein [Amycolatopsis antarctica]OZM73744.1 lipase [Amycolatopsis antarctica]
MTARSRSSRSFTRMFAALGVAALATLGAGTTASAAEEAAVNYVALGDSYSAGVGAGDYGDSGSCKRSANAYPQLWANANSPASFEFAACLGAVTDDVLSGQLGALNADTSLVTISIGGNDAGFVDVMIDCTLSNDQGCVDRVAEAKAFATSELPGRLDNVYSQIKSKAPNADLVVLNYPRFYEIGGSCNGGLSDVKREAINSGADALSEVTSERASAAGAKFADVRTNFAGHGICSEDWWLRSVTVPVDESYHPNAAGQSGGYLPALTGVTG